MMQYTKIAGALLAATSLLAGCGGDDDAAPAPAPETRAQDTRSFTIDQAKVVLPALADTNVETDRWTGAQGGAAYLVEVPKNWNGMLVMYAHGYRGTVADLTVSPPPIRKWLVENGYAWAASSYSRNWYDVRAGVEDTNALALAFERIAAQNGRALAAPTKVYITGHSMGGHIAAAAVDEENIAAANNKVRYAGSVPMCGVMGDTELFDFFAAYQVAAQQLAGVPVTTWPVASFQSELKPRVQSALFTQFPGATTPAGDQLKQIVKNLTGGERPLFDTGFHLGAGGYTSVVWDLTFGRDGKVNGILGRDLVDTRGVVYQLDDDPALSAQEQQFNAAAFRVTGDPDANRLRPDGLRWIPKTNARIGVPMVSIHTLGDMYVPFSMQQIYKRRADAQGTSGRLVQRAMRGVTHCDFTLAEQEEAFKAMADWEQRGVKPAGDDVLTPATVADPAYGCRFSRAPRADDSTGTRNLRQLVPACPAGSAAS